MIGPLLAEMLEDLGHSVCPLEVSPMRAVAAAERCHPDLMILDLDSEDAGSVAAVRDILRDGFVPHVFVTADVLRGLTLGPRAVLIQKPFRGPDIVAAIQSAVTTARRTAMDVAL